MQRRHLHEHESQTPARRLLATVRRFLTPRPRDTIQEYSRALAVQYPEVLLHTGYTGRVDIGSRVLDQYRLIGDRVIRIKVIDGHAAGFNFDRDYTTMDLVRFPAITIDENDNEFYEFCKLMCIAQLLKLDPRFAANYDHELLHALVSALEDTHYSTAVQQFPLLAANGNATVYQLKELYHHCLVHLAPVDVFFNVWNYLVYLYQVTGIISVHDLNTIVCVTNLPNFENAYWTGKYAVFGNGDQLFYPLTSMDVIGHELSHGLIDTEAGLEYQGHSGALNESFADVFGSVFQSYMHRLQTQGDSNHGPEDIGSWYIGENIVKNGEFRNLRDMRDPHNSYTPQPRAYEGDFYINPSSMFDFGGVHVNSGIINHCFYQLAQRTDEIFALNVYHQTLKKLKSTSTFHDFAFIIRSLGDVMECATEVDDALNCVQLRKQTLLVHVPFLGKFGYY